MKKQIYKSWKSFLLTMIAALIVVGASGTVFAQDKYPKPDFSAMEKSWEIVEYEYDFTPLTPALVVIAKPKQKSVPKWWDVTFLDAKGVKLARYTLMFDGIQINQAKIGDPVRGESYAPGKAILLKVKSIIVTENADGGDARTAN